MHGSESRCTAALEPKRARHAHGSSMREGTQIAETTPRDKAAQVRVI